MIGLYKENKKKYEKILEYIKQNTDLPKELKQELNEVAEKYRICIYTLEKEEIIEEIEKCKKAGNALPLKENLHKAIFGNVRDSEVFEWEDEYEHERVY